MRRPTLTVCVTARDAEHRLALLLAEAAHYADEVVVGVDQASVDGTWEVARAGADRVFRFAHAGVTSPARMAGLERARGDWILFLDDDEGMDAAFPGLRDELLADPAVAAWALPRRWLTTLTPPRFLDADPWWPDFSLRLARADRSRLWKPPALHSGLRVVGAHGIETRTAILHYERVDRTPAARAAKVAAYRARGQVAATDRFYAPSPQARTAAVDPPPLRMPASGPPPPRRPGGAEVDDDIDDLRARPVVPGWGAEVEVDMPGRATAGDVLLVQARARNTGTLRWARTVRGEWPALGLAYRVTGADGTALPDLASRSPVGRDVPPGGSIAFIARVDVPAEPGEYVLDWQLLSELEHWFDQLGSPVARRLLVVEPAP